MTLFNKNKTLKRAAKYEVGLAVIPSAARYIAKMLEGAVRTMNATTVSTISRVVFLRLSSMAALTAE